MRSHIEYNGKAIEPECLQDMSSYGGDGTNVFPSETKKAKIKGTAKVHKKGKTKEAPSLCKSKLRILKQLQEEKEKKALLSKSVEILEKYKIQDDVHSLLHSSGTIGQAQTRREKRLLDAKFSKAGLGMSRDLLPCKRKGSQAAFSGNKVTEKLNPNQIGSKAGSCGGGLLPPIEQGDCISYSQSLSSHLSPICRSSLDMDTRSKSAMSISISISEKTDTHMPEDQTNTPITIPCDSKGQGTKTQDRDGDGSNLDCVEMNRPTIVHVARPNDVQKLRRDLPIIMIEQEIMEAINENSTVIVCGETGCGKTTQVPQFLYEAGFGSSSFSSRKGIVGVTQPRRVAVLATSKRVSFELGLRLGKEVGFQVRHDKQIGDNCSIKFMTDGILLRELQSDFLLKHYSVIIIDEAHERSLNTDILIGMLSRIISLRQKLYVEQREKVRSGVRIRPENMITQLKLVLMSATLRVEDFVSDRRLFHEPPPVIEIPTRQFPVTVHFSRRTDLVDYVGQAYKKVIAIHKRLPPGGILVFVTGQREVEYLCKMLRKASQKLAPNINGEADNRIAALPEGDMKVIDEACQTSNLPGEQHDKFSSYEEDSDVLETDSSLSDSGTESDLLDDSDNGASLNRVTPKKTSLISDFLKEPDSLASLKASFEALAKNETGQNLVEKSDLPVTPTAERCSEKAPASVGALYVLPLYAMLPAAAQLRVFEDVPEGDRLVVVATNVAETSLTIPRVKYVVDTGREKVKNYNYINGMATYEVQWISKASAAQRAGRAGRTGPGHCYRLYSAAVFSNIFSEFSSPDITKIPVDGVVLLMKYMGIDKVVNFPFPTPPETTALVDAERCLKALQALDGQGRLTPIGKAMAQYPMSPRHSRMLLTVIQIMQNLVGYRRANLVLGYAVATVAALSFPNPFLMQLEEINERTDGLDRDMKLDAKQKTQQQEKQNQKKLKTMAREAHAKFCNPSSDALTISYALQLFELAENRMEFCRNNLLHFKTMDEMSKLRKQVLQLVFYQRGSHQEFSWNHGNFEDVENAWRISSDKHPLQMNEEELLGQAICAGWVDRVAKRIRTVSELSEKDRKAKAAPYQSNALKETVFLHRRSSVSFSPPGFLVYTELLRTNRPYMHGVTRVESKWLVKYAGSLCSFSAPYTDPRPYYEPLNDQLLCWVRPTFGPHLWELPLHYLPIKDDILRVAVFACALLEGNVLPCLRSAQKNLVTPPSSILRPEASYQRRVGELLNKLRNGSSAIDSRAKLRKAWDERPQMLHSEIQCWFQEKFYGQFEELWARMHYEVCLEATELFPKRAKKDRKVKC